MVLLREYRIVLPFDISEYRTGQKYSVARSSRLATTGSNGVEVLVNKELFDETNNQFLGTYTEKIYHMEAYIPNWIKRFLPASAMHINEVATDKYPHCKTVCSFPFLGDRFELIIESRHALDKGDTENIHGLSPEQLKKRHVVKMDFATEKLTDKAANLESEDPTKFKSQKSGRGPLKKGWQKEAKPVMCAYKLLTVKCKIFGLQNKLEKWLVDFEEQIFLRFHKQVFCWQDDWWGMTHEQLLEYENKLFADMANEIHANTKELTPEEKKALEAEVQKSLAAVQSDAKADDPDPDIEAAERELRQAKLTDAPDSPALSPANGAESKTD
eukprot:TRINITY_DN26536_c0_g1_i1.p1 TRINITY_DN26536_c0_g1~~TRINITY_DN26536_c0_g1_i1.p1  ORF type:complete len:328 (-),score=106.58 TRINITY_DN26536_c0_g1_i1:82-1065(-)